MARADHKDYSSTPLWKKLGIAEGARVRVLDAPDGLDRELTALAPLPDGVSFLTRTGRDLDVILAFFMRASALRRRIDLLARAIAPAGRLWIAWPKRAAQTDTDVDFDLVHRTGLATGLVDNKSGSITDVFQGLQFVRRKADRPR
ncbi:MAG TPA: DUF3052 domain-containing protein [Actinomycetota bacterium]|jgi:hypothetical protein|nr:DUF3052 domain-containing protein [Actinomycetota bacterium]